jgi:gp32 DNA binding protein like
MSVNIEEMRKKLKNSKENRRGNTNSQSNIWKPEVGEYEIRVLPTSDNDPFKKLFIHYNVGKTAILCPKNNYGEDCPVCSFATKLYKSSQESGDKDELEMAKQLFVKDRYYSPIVVRGKEDDGVVVWSYSKTIYEELLEAIVDPEVGDISDLDQGFDIMYTKKMGKKTFPEIKIKLKRSSSSLCGDLGKEKCDKLLETIPDFDNLFVRLTTAEVQQKLDEHMTSSNSEEKPDTAKYGDKSTSVDQAFDDLMA